MEGGENVSDGEIVCRRCALAADVSAMTWGMSGYHNIV